MIRPATVRDVPAIAALINVFAERGIMLFRSHANLYETVRDFVVLEENREISGVCGLEIVWSDLAEVRSLAVAPGHQGRGIGRRLVEACVAEARRLEIPRVFTLTYERAFFEKSGFCVVEKSALPQKVWSACIKCPKRLACDEIAMMRTLFEAPPVDVEELASLRYEVPTPLVQLNVTSEPRPAGG